jgi:dual oxidase
MDWKIMYLMAFFFIISQVYFLWVTKTQKQFEWLVDIIRHVENENKGTVVSIHIFITQFYQKFDLRTILLVTLFLTIR